MTPSQVGAFVDGIIPIAGGTVAALYGFRVIGKKPGADAQFEQWYARFGGLLRFLGPMIVLFGIWRIVPAFVTSEAPSAPMSESSRLFPGRLGNTWIYQAPGGLVTFRVTAIEPIGTKDCYRREMSFDGKVISTEHLRVEQGALWKYSLNGARFSPSFLLVYDSAVVPRTWEYRSENGRMSVRCEQTEGGPMQVPSGRYERTTLVRMLGVDSTGETSIQCWYAEGVGLIREINKSSTAEILLELKAFSQAP